MNRIEKGHSELDDALTDKDPGDFYDHLIWISYVFEYFVAGDCIYSLIRKRETGSICIDLRAKAIKTHRGCGVVQRDIGGAIREVCPKPLIGCTNVKNYLSLASDSRINPSAR